MIYCANIGDSRSILIEADEQNQWKHTPLSKDHKPDEPGEKKRILERGGRIDTYRDEEGNEMGPFRVWLKDSEIPGLAMSRSFGDYVASQVGVICEPEIQILDIKERHKMVLQASDGIWEFLDNDEVS